MKFIHIADVHLGVVPDAGKSWSEKRAADIWTTFTEGFAVAKDQGRYGADRRRSVPQTTADPGTSGDQLHF